VSSVQIATLILLALAVLAGLAGLILNVREYVRGREDVRFHGHGEPDAAIAAHANLTRAAGLMILGVTDLGLCSLVGARVMVDPIPFHIWGATLLDVQAFGFLVVVLGEWRARALIGRVSVKSRGPDPWTRHGPDTPAR
jgi:hypothetical protein